MAEGEENVNKVDGSSFESEVASAANSFDQKCPICLEDYDDKAFVNVCFHAFCFICIIQWSEVTNSCPLCKAVFKTIIHDVKSNSDYKTYTVNVRDTKGSQEVSINEARRFRYRTTLTGETQEHRRPRVRQSRKPASDERRKTVYLAGLRALPFAIEGKKTRVRDISTVFFKNNPAATHRLLPWLSRDIKVLLGEEHVEFVVQVILSLIDRINLESPDFIDHLQPFLHEKTEHFVHELISFAKSPLDMTAYDNKVSYGLSQKITTQREGKNEQPMSEVPSIPGPSHSTKLPSTDPSIQQRIFHEVASTSWDDSPPLTRHISPDQEGSSQGYPIQISSEDEEEETGHDRKILPSLAVGNLQDFTQVHEISCSSVSHDEPPAITVIGDEAEMKSDYTSHYGKDPLHKKYTAKGRKNLEVSRSPDHHMSRDAGEKYPSRKHSSSRSPSTASSLRELKYEDKRHSRRRKMSHSSSSDLSPLRRRKTRSSSSGSRSCDSYQYSRRKSHDPSKHSTTKSKRAHKHEMKRSHDRSHDSKKHSRDTNKHQKRSQTDRSPDLKGYHRRRSHDYGGYDSERRHERSLNYKKYHKRSHDGSRDRHKRSHNHKYSKTSHDKSGKSHDHFRATKGDYDGEPSSLHNNDLYLLPNDEINKELTSVENDITNLKRKLLKNLLHKERIELLQRALHEEKTGDELTTPTTTTPTYTEQMKDDSDYDQSIDELVHELKSVEEAIIEGKRQVLSVVKRMEIAQQREDSNEDENNS